MKQTYFLSPQLLVSVLLLLMGIDISALCSPNQISYQGKLTDTSGQPAHDSTYSVTFALYQAPSGGTALWSEAGQITTQSGIFIYLLGSTVPLPQKSFQTNDSLFLELSLDGISFSPRTRLVSSPYALAAGGITARNSTGTVSIKTIADSSALFINQPSGDTGIILHGGLTGDSAVIFPEGAVSSVEISDEPGISVSINTSPVTLVTGTMIDLAIVDITIPADGYLILEGKCYVELRGTTGANKALIQIDEEEGGSSQFPYFALAGLNGYVNTGSNYFPIYVTRPYFKEKGSYRFRMEGRAQNSTPATAISWDHVLNVVYYPTAYDAVKSISSESGSDGIRITADSTHPGNPDVSHPYYLHDLRKLQPVIDKRTEQNTPPR